MAFLRKIASLTATDAELATAYRNAGDLSVLGELYNRYMEMVYGVCLKYLKSPEEAQDAVMAIFEELVTKLRLHSVDNFKSWLYTLSKNHCLMKLRQQKKQPLTSLNDAFVQSEEDLHLKDALAREEDFRQLDECMEQLPDTQRNAVKAFYLEGKCYNEISAETGLEWNAVRSAIQNGRRNLRLCIEKGAKKMSTNE